MRWLALGCFGSLCLVTVACGHDWDPLDPRVDAAPGGAGGMGATGSGGAVGSTSGDPTSSSSVGGAGGGTSSVGGAGGSTSSGGGAGGSSSSSGSGGSSPTCPSNYVLNPNTNRCYHYEGASRTWDAQRNYCQGKGSGWDLTSITTAAERDFIDAQVAPSNIAWIGGRDLTMMDVFEWVSMEPWSFAPWEQGDPNGGNEDCVQLKPVTGAANDEFRDNPCSGTASTICEGPAS